MAMRRLLALAAAATVVADVVQVALFCPYLEARTANREDCDTAIAALDAINNKTDGIFDELIPNTFLDFTVAFEGCGDNHPDTGVGDDAFEVWKNLPIKPVAAIGPACSSSVKKIASVANREKLGSNAVIISEGSTSTSISDRDEYPNVVRLASTEKIVMQALGALSEHYDWKRIAIVYNSADVWASDAAKVFARTIEAAGGEVLGDACVTATCDRLPEAGDVRGIRFNNDEFTLETANRVLDELERIGAKIAYIAAMPRQQRPIFQQVKRNFKMYGIGFAWMSGWLNEDVLLEDTGVPNIESIEGAQGTLMAGERPDHEGDVFRAFAEHRGRGLSEEACTGPRRPNAYCDIDGDPMTLGMFAANAIDAVVILAKALDTLDAADRQDPDLVYAAIQELEPFEGASGRVVLNEINERVGIMTVTNLQLIVGGALGSGDQRRLAVTLTSTVADFVPVGDIEDGEFVEGGVMHTDGKFYTVRFPGDTTDVPPDRDDEGLGSSKKTGARRRARRLMWVWLTIFEVFAGVLICTACCLGVLRVRGALQRKRSLEIERAVIVAEQTTAAHERVQEFQAHFVTISGTRFMAFDRLRPQEELRDKIVIYDSVAEVRYASARGEIFIFFSHQWLGWSEPDPQRVHVAAMQQAVNNVSKETETPLEKIRVWVDYVSIPQKNRSEQKLAIASLPTFASCCDYFVVIAPDAIHKNTGCTCNSRSYRRRAWCRAEIMSCWARNSTSDMYYNSNDGLKPLVVSDEILAEALDVISGEFTCCRLGHPNEDPCDREALMLPLLGLYADIYRERHGKHADAYAFIEPIKDCLFPATFEYTHRSPDGVETTTTQVLFGDLVAAVEYATDQEKATAHAPDFKPGTNAQRHRLIHAKHGSKHGSGRLSSIFGSSGSHSSSGSVGAPAPAGPSNRAELPPALTWRASPPGPRQETSTQV